MTDHVEKTFSVTAPDGREIEFEASADITHDASHGSDADGRRGIPATFIDDVRIAQAEKDRIINGILDSLAGVDWDD